MTSTAPKRRGRPRCAPGTGRDVQVLLRLTEPERWAWGQLADAAGMTLSAWIRHRCAPTDESDIIEAITDV